MLLKAPHPVLGQFPLYTVMVFDEWQNGIPVAYCITSTSKQADLTPWLESLKKKMTDFQMDWYPNAFIVDCAQGEINTLKYVFLDVELLMPFISHALYSSFWLLSDSFLLILCYDSQDSLAEVYSSPVPVAC